MATGSEKLDAFFAANDAAHAARRAKDKAKIQKKVDKKFAGKMRKHVLPIAAGTEGILRGAAKTFEGTRNENAIRKTQGDANRAAANTRDVASRSANGPVGRMLAKRVVKKGVKAGMKEGGDVAKQMLGAAAKDSRRRR
jgi:hypothetical protein